MSCLRPFRPPGAGLALLLLAARATVVRGPSETLRVESTPAGAEVQLSNGQSCAATPCAFSLPRSNDVTVTVTRTDCAAAQVQVSSQFSRIGAAGMAGNAVIPAAGVVGLAVDGASGAARSLTPNPVKVRLRCASPAAPPSGAPLPGTLAPEAPLAEAPTAEAPPGTPPLATSVSESPPPEAPPPGTPSEAPAQTPPAPGTAPVTAAPGAAATP